MKIMLIMTGGTICSYSSSGVLSPDAKAAAPVLVDELYRHGFGNVEFDVRQVLDILSENMTFPRLSVLLSYIAAIPEEELAAFGGVIIAHGTDTLAYTSNLLAYALAGFKKPVMLVSSNYILDRAEANGHANFRAAVELIQRGFGAGVYVPYRNSDGTVYLHRGGELEQCRNYTYNFYSCSMKPVESAEPYVCESKHPLVYSLYRGGKCHLDECVMMIEPYVGIDYSAYRPSPSVRAVLHGSYHSATACVERASRHEPFTRHSALYMLEYCKSHGIDFYFSGVPESDDPLDGAYSTTADLIKSGAKPVFRLTNEAAYMKLVLAYSLGYEGYEVEAFMSRKIL